MYQSYISPLSVVERLELARLIMSDLMKVAPHWVIQEDDAWSEEDLADFSLASRHYSISQMDDDND
ncbi:MAG: hypothetical protein Fur0022_41450 [Anaerolineales bacterium]